MTIKYQVFISSTYGDLRDEREQILKATLEMGHIPVGMEMFSAADEEQWKVITRQIDECDYYAVIVAHRYGSTVGGISYTEKEYDYAVSKGIPVLGFVIEPEAKWPTDRVDTETGKKLSLEKFKAKVKGKPVNFWASAADLHGKFSISFMKQIVSNPRPGWARATDVAGPEVVKELTRLSSENAELRRQLAEALHKTEDDATAERNRIIETLRKNKIELCFFYHDSSEYEDNTEEPMSALFFLLAPEMMIEQSTEDISYLIGFIIRPDKERDIRAKYPVPANSLRRWIADFFALGVFEPSPERHSVSDNKEYWSLSKKGREVYMQIRREKLEKIPDEQITEHVEDQNALDDKGTNKVPKSNRPKTKAKKKKMRPVRRNQKYNKWHELGWHRQSFSIGFVNGRRRKKRERKLEH